MFESVREDVEFRSGLDRAATGGEPLGIVLEVGDRSDVGIWQRDESRWIDILPWTQSNAVHLATEPKELLVTTQGSGLPFVVNGVRSRQHHLQRSACRR